MGKYGRIATLKGYGRKRNISGHRFEHVLTLSNQSLAKEYAEKRKIGGKIKGYRIIKDGYGDSEVWVR